MQCPKCQSDNTQRLQVVYDGGTQNISTSSSSVIVSGVGSGMGGGTIASGAGPC